LPRVILAKSESGILSVAGTMSGREIANTTGGVPHSSTTEDFTFTNEVSSVGDTHQTRRSASFSSPRRGVRGFRAGIGLRKIARRTLGIILLLFTVVLWTGSNFLASVSYPHAGQWLLTNGNLSSYSRTIRTQSLTSSPTSIQHSLPYRYSLYFSKLPILAATARLSHQQSAIGKAA